MATRPDAKQKIDDYIDSLPDFSRDICKKLRHLIHQADKGIIEDWKWGPNFSKNGLVVGFGAFKGWVTLTFFQGSQMKDFKKLFNYGDTNAHNRSIKFTQLGDIKDKDLISYIKEAVIIDTSSATPSSTKDKSVDLPADFKTELTKAKLLNNFEKLTFTHRKEYVDWITSAKKEITRTARLTKAIKMLSNSKPLA